MSIDVTSIVRTIIQEEVMDPWNFNWNKRTRRLIGRRQKSNRLNSELTQPLSRMLGWGKRGRNTECAPKKVFAQ